MVAARGLAERARLLLQNGVEVTATNKDGETPLDTAEAVKKCGTNYKTVHTLLVKHAKDSTTIASSPTPCTTTANAYVRDEVSCPKCGKTAKFFPSGHKGLVSHMLQCTVDSKEKRPRDTSDSTESSVKRKATARVVVDIQLTNAQILSKLKEKWRNHKIAKNDTPTLE